MRSVQRLVCRVDLSVRAGVKEQQFCRFDEQRPHGRGRGKKLYRSFYMR